MSISAFGHIISVRRTKPADAGVSEERMPQSGGSCDRIVRSRNNSMNENQTLRQLQDEMKLYWSLKLSA